MYTASANRIEKARKIDGMLCDFFSMRTLENRKMLDDRCGSGHIARHFGERSDVTAADIVDQRDADQRNGMRFGNLVIESSIFPLEMVYEHRLCLPSVGPLFYLA